MRGTIKQKEDVERLFRMGRRSSSSFVTVLVSDSLDQRGRCAFIAGKKLGSAPMRNRCKRVMREIARELGAPWSGYDVAIVARPGIAFANHEEARMRMREALSKAGVVSDEH